MKRRNPILEIFRAHSLQIALATIVCIPVIGYPVWAFFDRAPPYIREGAVVLPADTPARCGLPADDPTAGTMEPGSCIHVEWKIKVIRNCPPDRPDNITRRIRDSEVIHIIPQALGMFGASKEPAQLGAGSINRYFRIPSAAQPGPATYISAATFACNPLQRWLPWLFWPITIDKPDAKFTIEGGPPRLLFRQGTKKAAKAEPE
jgi:hypothetical protein